MNESKNKPISAFKICIVALAIVINIIGGQIALLLKLPIYLDSIGTFFIGATLGPVYGMIPNLISGLIMGFTGDVYSLYYAPVGMLLGLMVGLVCKKRIPKKGWILLAALIIALPSTIVSSCITAGLFGGITSSGSTVLVQLLAKTPVGLTGACFIVQLITDYVDRVISLFVVVLVMAKLPYSMMEKLRAPQPDCE